uniref:Putative secreted protein n=1 Tax=Amblyomma triste TaxID=251400 RepID=A0A023G2H4_AMBTT
MKCTLCFVLFMVISNVIVEAIYSTLGQSHCRGPCDPLSNVQPCMAGCLCFRRKNNKRLGDCFKPGPSIPGTHEHPRHVPNLPPRVPLGGTPGAGSPLGRPLHPTPGSPGALKRPLGSGSPINRPLPQLPGSPGPLRRQ